MQKARREMRAGWSGMRGWEPWIPAFAGMTGSFSVIPAKAGIQSFLDRADLQQVRRQRLFLGIDAHDPQ
jgi:hypothetical protein